MLPGASASMSHAVSLDVSNISAIRSQSRLPPRSRLRRLYFQ
jgi:hypothetical protein